MILEKTRLGKLEYNSEDVFTFQEGLLGFQDFQKFLILQHRAASAFRWLQSIEDPTLAFLIVNPLVYLSDYVIPDVFIESTGLKIGERNSADIFTIVTIPHAKAEEATVNLAAPLIINNITRNGKQIILDDESFSIKYKIDMTTPKSPEQVA